MPDCKVCGRMLRTEYEKVVGVCEYCRQGQEEEEQDDYFD